MISIKQFETILQHKLKRHEPLAGYTTYKIGGPADYFLEATSAKELAEAVTAARSAGIPVFILGGGSNILVGDKGYRGLVIKNNSQEIKIVGMKGTIANGSPSGDVYVEAESGVSFNSLVRFTVDEGLAGLEMQLGLPGTVGGALFMNSKWVHEKPSYVGDVVHQVSILTPGNEIKVVNRSYFHFQYGSSILQSSGDIVLSVIFVLRRSDKDSLWQTANNTISYRRQTQPQGVKTAGCVFKNISQAEAIAANTPNLTTSAGFLIDHAGCKKLRIGDISVSPIHANFFVNEGKGTAVDMVQLIDIVKQKVFDTFRVQFKEEILRIGEF